MNRTPQQKRKATLRKKKQYMERIKRGRPSFESDGLKEFMMKAIKNMSPSDCKRTLQNKYYESIVTSVLIKMEEAGEDVKLLWNRERPKIKGISLFYEIGRIEDEELIEAVLRQLIKEMAENPGRTVKEWEKDLRKYRLNLGNRFLNSTTRFY